jgi:transposase-like protein
MMCKFCKSKNVVKAGRCISISQIKQKYFCKDCGKYFCGEKLGTVIMQNEIINNIIMYRGNKNVYRI